VLLADDQAIVRFGLRVLLRQRGYRVVAEASDGSVALQEIRRHKPDLAVLESTLPGLKGIEVARQTAKVSPRTRTILFTAIWTKRDVLEAVRDGVRAFVLKSQGTDDLFRAIREVVQGGIYIGPGPSMALARQVQAVGAPTRALVTPRELEVLELIASSKTMKEIAALLRISVKTVGFHRGRIMQKLDIHDLAGLVRFAVRQGLITP